MVFAQGNTSLTASHLLMQLNMLINVTFIIIITFFNYIVQSYPAKANLSQIYL